MCNVSLLKSRFDRLNGNQILEPLINKKKKKPTVLQSFLLFGDLTLCITVTFKKGSIHGRASLLHL